MSGAEPSDLFADAEEQIRTLEARIAELTEEAETAAPERRKEIGWWIHGATKYIGKLADAERNRGEHRFVIHEADEDASLWAVCSCGARFAGEMHEDFTLAEFPLLLGHLREMPTPPGGVSDSEGGN